MNLVACTYERHAEAILGILNEAILNSTALYDYRPRALASIAMHLQQGFVHAGTIRHAGYKFGRWLDLAFYQRILGVPAQPHDD